MSNLLLDLQILEKIIFTVVVRHMNDSMWNVPRGGLLGFSARPKVTSDCLLLANINIRHSWISRNGWDDSSVRIINLLFITDAESLRKSLIKSIKFLIVLIYYRLIAFWHNIFARFNLDALLHINILRILPLLISERHVLLMITIEDYSYILPSFIRRHNIL